jgi:hypothetical protein
VTAPSPLLIPLLLAAAIGRVSWHLFRALPALTVFVFLAIRDGAEEVGKGLASSIETGTRAADARRRNPGTPVRYQRVWENHPVYGPMWRDAPWSVTPKYLSTAIPCPGGRVPRTSRLDSEGE